MAQAPWKENKSPTCDCNDTGRSNKAIVRKKKKANMHWGPKTRNSKQLIWRDSKIKECFKHPIVLSSLQSKKILNRPVFVLNILNRVWTSLKILNIDWKMLNRFWTLTEQSLWTLLKILNIDWTLLNILNIDWTDSEHYWKFWTDSEHWLTESEHYWTFWTLTEQVNGSFYMNPVTGNLPCKCMTSDWPMMQTAEY